MVPIRQPIIWRKLMLFKMKLLFLWLEGEETSKCCWVCRSSRGNGPCSNDHGRTQKFNFSVLNWKYPFGKIWSKKLFSKKLSKNLIQKLKIVSLNWSLVSINANMQNSIVVICLFLTGNTDLEQTLSKNSKLFVQIEIW